MKDDPQANHTQHDPQAQYNDASFEAPRDHDAEQLVLGYCLTHPEQAGDVLTGLSPHHFHHFRYETVFRAMREIHDRDDGIDLFPVAAELTRMGALDEVGGHAALTALADGIPPGTTIDSAMAQLRRVAWRRDVALATHHATLQAQAGHDPDTLIENLRAKLVDLEARHTADTKPTLHPLGSSLQGTLTWVAAQHDGSPHIGLAAANFPTLTERTMGLRGLMLLAAQPGQGGRGRRGPLAGVVRGHRLQRQQVRDQGAGPLAPPARIPRRWGPAARWRTASGIHKITTGARRAGAEPGSRGVGPWSRHCRRGTRGHQAEAGRLIGAWPAAAGGKRRDPMDDPHVVLGVGPHADGRSEDPMVRQWLGP